MGTHKYFLYSLQQVNDKNVILDRVNKQFVPGTVVYGGKTREYSVLSDKKTIDRYTDVRIMAEGDPKLMHYTLPTTKAKIGNN